MSAVLDLDRARELGLTELQAPRLVSPPHPLAARAAANYPDSDALQAEWIRAVGVVRGTARGWLLDPPKEAS